MYKSQPPSQMLPPPELGTPPPAEPDPMGDLLAGKASTQITPEMKYHQQRMDVLAALKRAIDKGADPHNLFREDNQGQISPQQNEAQTEFNRLFEIYSKLPGGTNLMTGGNPFLEQVTPWAQDTDWAGKETPFGEKSIKSLISGPSRYDFGKTPAGRMK